MRKAVFAIIAVLFAFNVHSQQKQNLSVLYVGYSPDKEMPKYHPMLMGSESKAMYIEEYSKRMPSFVNFLKKYFKNVGSIDARDYKESDSEKYDVTIFDQLTKKLEREFEDKDPVAGEVKKIKYRSCLSDDFSKPSLLIGHMAEGITMGLGVKFDWQ